MIRAVIADDSAFLRKVLEDVLNASNRIKVVGSAKNGKEAVALVKQHKPDILILDVEMPVMNGLEALRAVMSESPLPVFMFSSLTQEGASVTIKALEYGAVDFFPKPMGGAHSLDKIAEELISKIRAIVFRKRPFKPGIARPGVAPQMPKLEKRKVDIIAMGSSTGGVQAAIDVVPKLPADTRPIVWVQHMPQNFTKSFADRLNGLSSMRVKEAENGDILEDGVCYLGRGGIQMQVKKHISGYRLELKGEEKVTGHCPSCNVLFDSVSEYFGKNSIGVILTGMGDDGTKGLVKMHDKGAFVIGQAEASCVVYGMPRAAHQAGAVDVELDVKDIHKAIVKAGGAGA